MSIMLISVVAMISLYALARIAKRKTASKELIPIAVSQKANPRRR